GCLDGGLGQAVTPCSVKSGKTTEDNHQRPSTRCQPRHVITNMCPRCKQPRLKSPRPSKARSGHLTLKRQTAKPTLQPSDLHESVARSISHSKPTFGRWWPAHLALQWPYWCPRGHVWL